MKAILVRHGQTDYNARQLFQGYAPIPLSVQGRQQAERVGRRLQSLRPTTFYSSDIARAYETAQIISQHIGLPIQLHEGLREWNSGAWIGLPAQEYFAHLEAIGAHQVTYIPDGGESQLHAQARIIATMDALAERHAGELILGVSHGMAIDLFIRHVLRLDVMEEPAYHIENTSLTVVRHGESGWQLVTLNDMSHLEDLAAS